MRTLTIGFLAATALGGFSTARAADLDYDYLRGPDLYEPVASPVIDWSGVYLGGHGGYTSGGMSQRDVFQSSLADYFRARDIEDQFSVSKLLALPGSRARGSSYGGFGGYNFQFDEAVVGFEVDYTHFGHATSSSASIGRSLTTTAGIDETVRLFGKSATNVEDYGSVRARLGYAFENVMPFVTGGLAVGQVSFADTVSVQNYGYDAKTYTSNQALTTGAPLAVYNHGYASFNPNYPIPGTSPAGQTQTVAAAPVTLTPAVRSKTVAGFALGGGLEYAFTSNFLVRGEYQYVRFQDFNGHAVELNTVRGGAAYKF